MTDALSLPSQLPSKVARSCIGHYQWQTGPLGEKQWSFPHETIAEEQR